MRPTPLLFSGSHGDAALLPPNSSRSHSPCPFPNFCYSSRPAAGLGPPRAQFCGCSSAVERYLAKVNVEGSIPFTRFEDQPEGPAPSGCAFSRKWLVFRQKRAGAPSPFERLAARTSEDRSGPRTTPNDPERHGFVRLCAHNGKSKCRGSRPWAAYRRRPRASPVPFTLLSSSVRNPPSPARAAAAPTHARRRAGPPRPCRSSP